MKQRTNETRKIDDLLPPVASDVLLSERPLPLPVKGDEIVRTPSKSATYSEVLHRSEAARTGNQETVLSGQTLLERLSASAAVRQRRRNTVLVAAICAIVLAAVVLGLINIH